MKLDPSKVRSDEPPPRQTAITEVSDAVKNAIPLEADGGRTIEQEEFLNYRTKLRAGLGFGVTVYTLFFITDYLIADLSGVPFWEVFRVRFFLVLFVLLPLVICVRRLELSEKVFRVAEVVTYSVASAGVVLMCIPTGGVKSVYFAGVMLVLVARSAFVSEHWRQTLLPSSAIALQYPLVLGLATLFSEEILAQFATRETVLLFVIQYSLILCIAVMSAWAGHQVWALRRKVYESRALGRYRLERRIGSGGMGEVWSATHPRLRRKVAIKILRKAPEGEFATHRFEREFAATSTLSHPNTVRVFDYGLTEDGILYYVMELLDGEPLSALLRREGPLHPARAIHLVDQAARALGEAHQLGICHRDVKPENLYITWSGEDGDFVKVLDFGVAKHLQGSEAKNLTQTGAVVGTPEYLSPEVARGEPADARSDVYALGVVLFHCVTGRTPFEGEHAGALMFSHINVDPPRPSDVAKQVIPADLEAVIMRCLQKDPDDRFEDATLLSIALSRSEHYGKWRPTPGTTRPEATSGVISATHSGGTTRVDLRNPGSVLDEMGHRRVASDIPTPDPS